MGLGRDPDPVTDTWTVKVLASHSRSLPDQWEQDDFVTGTTTPRNVGAMVHDGAIELPYQYSYPWPLDRRGGLGFNKS